MPTVSRRHLPSPPSALRRRLAAPARRPRSRSSSSRRGPVLYRQRRVGRTARVRAAEAADDGQGSDPVGVGTAVARGRSRASPAPAAPPPHLARRAPQPGQRAARRDGDRRPAPDHPRPGRALHAPPAPPPRGPPGITGWAQVQGRAGIPWEERIELDVWYVEHRSLALDLRSWPGRRRALLGGPGQRGARPICGLRARFTRSRRAAEREQARERLMARGISLRDFQPGATPRLCTAGSTTRRRRRT